MFKKEAEKYCGNLDESKIKDFITDAFKDGAEFGYNKAKEEMQKNGLALQSDMDKTIEQNIALKKELNKAKEELRGKHNVDWRKIKKTTKGVEQDNSEEIKYRNSNLNYYIKIKLTEEGRIIYKKHYAKYNCEAPKLNIDNEGYVQFQIHDFMHIFGERLFMGATLPCETYCKIQVSM